MISDEVRRDLFETNETRINQLAAKAYKASVESGGTEFIVIVINVDDPTWTWLVDELMPGHNWQQYRDKGQVPIARGIVSGDLKEVLGKILPTMKDALRQPPTTGTIHVLVLDAGGATLFFVTPT